MKAIARKSGWLVRAALWCSLIHSPFAAATMVDIATLEGGYHAAVMAQPSALLLGDLMSSSAGTVTLTTKTFDFGDLLSVLTTNVFIEGAPALTLTGPGTLVFNVGANQIFSTSLRIAAAGPKGYGMAGYDLSFAPSVATVPLPAGVWLLAGGIGLLASRVRKRA